MSSIHDVEIVAEVCCLEEDGGSLYGNSYTMVPGYGKLEGKQQRSRRTIPWWISWPVTEPYLLRWSFLLAFP